MATHYELLGIPRVASAERVKRSYRNLVKIYHPDRFPSGSKAHAEAEKRIREINIAYGVLSKPQSRANYDATLQEQTFSRPGPEPGTLHPLRKTDRILGHVQKRRLLPRMLATEPSGLLLDRDALKKFPSHIVGRLKQAFRLQCSSPLRWLQLEAPQRPKPRSLSPPIAALKRCPTQFRAQ